MKKSLKRKVRRLLLTVVINTSMILTNAMPFFGGTVSNVRGASAAEIGASDFLKAEEGFLKNKNGEVVALRGVNAGGWLIQESWMCPVNGADRAWANLDTLNKLKERGFTADQIQKLFDTYQDNWFTTIDLDNLQKMGVNCVRVPFWYRNFMSDEKGTWITGNNLDSNPGIKRLDWVIEECGKRGMYVILDCHGAPGGQSMDHCCGTLCKNELYDSDENRAILKDLWTNIAKRYKGNPVVAAYDILNEPQNNGGYNGENAWAPGSSEALERTYSVYDEMYKAIREVDPDHVISMEAIWEGSCLPDPSTYEWSNLLYQMHVYDTSRPMIETRVNELKYFQSQYGTAVYVGEFNCDPNEEFAMNMFNEAGINWTTWAYKGSKQSLGNNWFLYVKNIDFVDSENDSYEEMLRKWGSVLKTDNFDVNTNTVKAWIENNINAPVAQPPEPPKPVEIPGEIEAENYTLMSGIQIESCTEGGIDVGHFDVGDWLEYKIVVPASGSYRVKYRVASAESSGQIQLQSNGTVLATTDVPNTGDWQSWKTVSATVDLKEGEQTIRLYASGEGFNINYIKFTNAGEDENEDEDEDTEITADDCWLNHFETATGFSAGENASVVSDDSAANIGGSKSVKLTVDSSGDPENDKSCVNITPITESTVDASKAKYLNFYIKDTQGANTVKITIVDSDNSVWSEWSDAKSVQDQWVKMSIDLKYVTEVDLSNIKEVRIGEWNSGTYYVDDVYFSGSKTSDIPAFSSDSQGGNENENQGGDENKNENQGGNENTNGDLGENENQDGDENKNENQGENGNTNGDLGENENQGGNGNKNEDQGGNENGGGNENENGNQSGDENKNENQGGNENTNGDLGENENQGGDENKNENQGGNGNTNGDLGENENQGGNGNKNEGQGGNKNEGGNENENGNQSGDENKNEGQGGNENTNGDLGENENQGGDENKNENQGGDENKNENQGGNENTNGDLGENENQGGNGNKNEGQGGNEKPNTTVQPGTTEKPTTEAKVELKAIKVTLDSTNIAAGKSVQLNVTSATDGAKIDKVTYSVNNTKYAKVAENGKVTTKTAGKGKSVKVTVNATGVDGGTATKTITIKIKKNEVTKVTISDKSMLSVKYSKKGIKLKATVETNGKSAYKKLQWTSSNPNYATVDKNGKVKFKAAGKGKTVKITAKALDGTGKKDTVKINIEK